MSESTRPFRVQGQEIGVVVDGREVTTHPEGHEQARLHRLRPGVLALTVSAGPGTFPCSVELTDEVVRELCAAYLYRPWGSARG